MHFHCVQISPEFLTDLDFSASVLVDIKVSSLKTEDVVKIDFFPPCL